MPNAKLRHQCISFSVYQELVYGHYRRQSQHRLFHFQLETPVATLVWPLPTLLDRDAVFFHQIVNHVVIDDDSREGESPIPTSMTESDGEKPHHIKAGIEPCTTERHELYAESERIYQLGHRATDDRIEFWSISPSQKEI